MVKHMEAPAEAGSYLLQHEQKDLLRFITCGSVDDGKSTLIGRLLFDSKLLLEDQLTALEKDSSRYGTTGSGELDLALLVDGLADEREQGITIDVAYRFFATEKRKFIVADTPGHEQYTRNMATGASMADLAVLLVDARKGLLPQTRRHSYIVSLLGIKHVVLAINKMDAVSWDRDTYERMVAEYREFAIKLDIPNVTCIPVSALLGDNITRRSSAMPWYDGATLIDHLEEVEVGGDVTSAPFRMPVQWINRPDQDFRGYSGTIASGMVSPGDSIVIAPSGRTSKIERIVTSGGDLQQAVANQAVTITLADEVDVSRGDVLADSKIPPESSDQFSVHILWMSADAMLPGRPYLLRIGSIMVGAQITEIKYTVNVNTLEHTAARHIDLNEVGVCNLALDRPIPFDPYRKNRDMGGFILIDRITNATVGCGMISFALRRASNIHWQALKVGKADRAGLKQQKPCIVWFTGLSGAGKSTIANLVERNLFELGRHTVLLDGDNIRHGLTKNLGFTAEDRVENIRRVAEVAKLMTEAGLIVLVSLISPFRSERQMAREIVPPGEFLEVFVDAPLEVCRTRDPKGLYKKAYAGELPNFTGIDSPYEPPVDADLHLNSADQTLEACGEAVLAMLSQRGIV
ncbi:MAG: sulfate adenylyltransferase subunit CysN [Ferrovibrio sp.]|uniref:sulfate adenylyltransferase subunit CysN n=1 Tax=Ferrovibrio sp. TaxID=1917215 RepID=UPI00263228BF|nr:sulfate adenylyltransferase subunit CysN [Ferrovibrio sp.]MCW0234957.1 sulfate adenylyltransferase subunit CysN [Ferrovibrio sp.]